MKKKRQISHRDNKPGGERNVETTGIQIQWSKDRQSTARTYIINRKSEAPVASQQPVQIRWGEIFSGNAGGGAKRGGAEEGK